MYTTEIMYLKQKEMSAVLLLTKKLMLSVLNK